MDAVRAEVGGVGQGPQFEQNLSGVASQQWGGGGPQRWAWGPGGARWGQPSPGNCPHLWGPFQRHGIMAVDRSPGPTPAQLLPTSLKALGHPQITALGGSLLTPP